jgi:uncharacterized protein HemX
MVYIISLLSVAAFPLAVAAYGGHLAAKVLDPRERRKALSTVWILAVLGLMLAGLQQVLIYRSDRAHEIQQAALEAKAEADQQQLRAKLDSSLQRQEDVRKQLDSILGFLRTPEPRMDARHLADVTSKMVENAMHR